MFSITRDPVQPDILVKLSGFWTTSTVDAYCTALERCIDAARIDGRAGLLIDCINYSVQSQEVTDRFGEWFMAWPPERHAGIIGIVLVLGSTLSKKQAERTFGPQVHSVLDLAAGQAWLADRRSCDLA